MTIDDLKARLVDDIQLRDRAYEVRRKALLDFDAADAAWVLAWRAHRKSADELEAAEKNQPPTP
jgi:hypothetical protein